MFIDAELSQIPITDGRKAERRIVNLAAALREAGARSAKVVVVDISTGGFKAESDETIEEGSEVWLKLPGLEAKRSRVIWTKERDVGCEFESPLHPKELDSIVAPAPRRIVKGVFERVERRGAPSRQGLTRSTEAPKRPGRAPPLARFRLRLIEGATASLDQFGSCGLGRCNGRSFFGPSVLRVNQERIGSAPSSAGEALKRVMDDVGERQAVDGGALGIANLDRLMVPAGAERELAADQLARAPHRLVPGRLGVGQGKPLLVLKPAAVAGEVEIVAGHGGRTSQALERPTKRGWMQG